MAGKESNRLLIQDDLGGSLTQQGLNVTFWASSQLCDPALTSRQDSKRAS